MNFCNIELQFTVDSVFQALTRVKENYRICQNQSLIAISYFATDCKEFKAKHIHYYTLLPNYLLDVNMLTLKLEHILAFILIHKKYNLKKNFDATCQN